ncbi:MAG: DUF6804 family protein [Lacibacter sp.]
MKFPTYISNIFRIIISVSLSWQIMYLLYPEASEIDRIYIILLNIGVCFTAIIGYINDKEKMLVISNKGLLVEEMITDPETKKAKLSFIYILIGIVYNPIIPLFYSNTLWVIMHGVTAVFFIYKMDRGRKSKLPH